MCSATCAILATVGCTSAGTATLGTRSRAILATCTDRSPIRSSSVTIRSAATTVRRSLATGCCRDSSENAVSSTRSRARSIATSALITRSAISLSPVSSASVARWTASLTWPQIVGEVDEDGVELLMEGIAHAGSLGGPHDQPG